MSGLVVQLINMPVTEIGNFLKVPFGLQTSIIILGFAVIWYLHNLLTYVNSSACNKSDACRKIFAPLDTVNMVILFYLAAFAYAYYFYEGVRAHGLISFKSYAKPVALLLFFLALKVIFFDLTTVLTRGTNAYVQEDGSVKEVSTRFFGRFINVFGGAVDDEGAGSLSLHPIYTGALIGVIVALHARR